MQRSKSIVEFQQLMRQDAQAALRSELDRLIDNADKDDREYFANEFTNFANLFERFLQERGPSIEWEKIRPPAEGMVNILLDPLAIVTKYRYYMPIFSKYSLLYCTYYICNIFFLKICFLAAYL